MLVGIIDDDEGVRSALAFYLQAIGFDTKTFASGAAFLADETIFSCLLIDYQLPVMTGLEVLSILRGLGSRTPAAIMTGSYNEALRERVQDLGAYHLFSKPLDEQELFSIIHSMAETEKPH